MAELTYAELTQGRESTRLPHTHKLTSLKKNRFWSEKSRYPERLLPWFAQDIKQSFVIIRYKECQKN